MTPPALAARLDAPELLLGLPAAALTWLLLRRLIPVLQRRLPDQPNARSSHRTPTPRGGGVAFVLVGSLASLSLLPLVCLPLALVGLIDDRRNLPAALRYGAQLLTALVLVALSPLQLPLPWLLLPLAVIAATAVINFVNFMDGLDGLVAGCMAVLLLVAALVSPAPALWALVGALLGFLPWNWSPARVFMGDVGSTFLGALLAGVVLQQATPDRALGLLLVAFPLLGDACLCVLRRLAAGQPVFQAHRLHLYQRLQQAGWSHSRVALLYMAATTVGGLALVGGGLWALLPVLAAQLLLALALERRVAVPFAAASAGGSRLSNARKTD